MKDILIIQPPASFNNNQPVLPQSAVGIGMLTIMAYIKLAGFDGEVIHIPRAYSSGYSLEDILERIKNINPKLIAIGLNWLHFSEGALQLAGMLRKLLPDTMIVVGGQHATLFASEIIECSNDIDGITIGESERTIYYLLKELKKGSRKIPSGIPGVMYKNSKGGIVSTMPEIIDNIDTLPFYSYKDVWPYTKEICAALDTVRGECIKNCSYCIESKTNSLQGRKKYTTHSIQYLAKQIKVFNDEGIDNITIQDPFCLVGNKKIQEFCKCLNTENIKLNLLNIFVEPMIFSEDTLRVLKEVANKVSLDYGMETGATETAEFIGRGFNKEAILDNLSLVSKMGIKILTWWMTGLPGDNRKTLKESMEYIEETIKCGAVPRWVTPLILFPHTDMAKKKEYYGVKPILESFTDFCNYSKVQANYYGVYFELLTHETLDQNKREIVESTIALKKSILDKISEHKTTLMSFGWTSHELDAMVNEAKASFY